MSQGYTPGGGIPGLIPPGLAAPAGPVSSDLAIEWAVQIGLINAADVPTLNNAQVDFLESQYFAEQGIRGPDPNAIPYSPGNLPGGYPPGAKPYTPPVVRAKLYPATILPNTFKMHHQKARGGHIAYMGQTEAAYFTRKPSCNAFVHAFNQMLQHLGSAASFDQLQLVGLLSAVLDAGSGANGVANNFRPPFNGS